MQTRLRPRPRHALAILAAASQEVWGGTRTFEQEVVAARDRGRHSALQLKAQTRMALGWFITVTHMYLTEGRRSLIRCFDEVVDVCVQAATHDLDRSRARRV